MANCRRVALIAAAFLGLASFAAGQSINEKVVAFCSGKLDQKVSDGQCSSLAWEALKSAEARVGSFKNAPNAADSVWGKLVYVLDTSGGARKETKTAKMTVTPGDVIQLRDAEFKGKNYVLTYPHHTAVVAEVKDKGKTFVVFEQNVNPQQTVVKSNYALKDLKAGWIRVYRPLPPAKPKP